MANDLRELTPEELERMNAPRCRARRPRTAARCEALAAECNGDHVGRDTAGRWHCWEEPPPPPDLAEALLESLRPAPTGEAPR